jgi:hypothetical protein
MRRRLVLLLLGGGSLWLFLRRREVSRERVSLYYDDGATLTLDHDSPGAGRLLALARAAI